MSKKRHCGRVRLQIDADEAEEMVRWIDEATAYIIECAPLKLERRTMTHLSGLNVIRRLIACQGKEGLP